MKLHFWNLLIQLLELLNRTLYVQRNPRKQPKPIRWKLLLIRLLANWMRFAPRSRDYEIYLPEKSKSKPSRYRKSRISIDSSLKSPSDKFPIPYGKDENKESH